ncbi:MAG: hypothetical protein GXO87_07505 [Chlorobi bacterium]|nr:hypothetical protein [Chlorobiota bacterium]
MSKYLHIIISSLFIFFAVADAIGQQNKVRFYTVNDGLSQNTVQAVFQDSQGYLWIGTEDGLNRFNGYEFKKFYNIHNDSNSIIYPDITDVIEPSFDRDVLWIGTRNGLSRYLKGERKFKNRKFDICENSQSGFNEINALRESNYFEKTVWISTKNGLIKYSAKNNSFERMLTACVDSSFSNTVKIREVVERKNILWVASSVGLIKFNLKDKTHEVFNKSNSILKEDGITSLFIDETKPEALWIGGTSNRIYLLDTRKIKFKKYEFKPHSFSGFSSVAFIDKFGPYIIIGTNSSGVQWFDAEKEKFSDFPFSSKEYLISSFTTSDHFIDRSGILWVGTISGLAKMNPLGEKFKTISKIHAGNSKLTENDVWAFCKDRRSEDMIWIGTDDGGIARFNHKRNEFTELEAVLKRINYNKNVFSMIHDSEGVLWLGTFDGLLKVDLTAEKYKWYVKGKGDKFLSDGRILAIKKSVSVPNLLFLGTVQGFNILDIRSGDIRKIFAEGGKGNKITANVVNVIFESPNNPGKVWIGTEDGLNKYSIETGKVTCYSVDESEHNFAGKFIMAILEDPSDPNYLWIASDNLGLIRFNAVTEKIEKIYAMKDGLPNKTIYGILGLNGFLWLSTNNGLSKFDVKKEKFENFSVADGLQGNEFNLGAYLKLKGGKMFFGGVEGFSYFHPESLKNNPVAPKVAIEEIKVLNKPVDFDCRSSGEKRINLSYKDNFITFSFSGLEFTAPEKNAYQYKLIGFHDKWVDNGNKRSATFTNLDPGEYLFKIRAANNDGVWGESDAFASLTIEPAFWMTWQFQGLIGIIIFINIFMFVYLRLQKPLELERLRMKIARDLHDEVGSSLTKISMSAGLLRFDSDKTRSAQRITALDEESRSVITTMSDVIWSIDSRNNKVGDLLDRMKNHAFKLFDDTDVDVSFFDSISNEEKKIKIDVRQNIYLIFKEAVNNAAKYSRSAKIEVKMENNKKNGFVLEITDFGIGLPFDTRFTGNGLSNMKSRAKKIDGKIEFINKNGLTIRLTRSQL